MRSCKEVARTIASDELANLSARRRLAVRFHLFRCRHCRRYEAQIRAIGGAVQELFGGPEESSATLDLLTEAILEGPPGAETDAEDIGRPH